VTRCGKVNQKILVVEMATEIKSLVLRVQFFFQFKKYIYWQPNLGHRIAIGVWIGQLKNLGY